MYPTDLSITRGRLPCRPVLQTSSRGRYAFSLTTWPQSRPGISSRALVASTDGFEHLRGAGVPHSRPLQWKITENPCYDVFRFSFKRTFNSVFFMCLMRSLIPGRAVILTVVHHFQVIPLSTPQVNNSKSSSRRVEALRFKMGVCSKSHSRTAEVLHSRHPSQR